MGNVVSLSAARSLPWLVCCNLRADRIDARSRSFCPGAGATIWNVRTVLSRAREAGWTVVHVIDRAGKDHCGPIEGLAPLASEPVFESDGEGSAFAIGEFKTAIERAGKPRLLVIGFDLEGLVLSTIVVARDEGVDAALVCEATASKFEKAEMDAALKDAIASRAASISALALAPANHPWRERPA
jgi:hypothetical protein